MTNQAEEYGRNKVFHYAFDDEDINSALAELNRQAKRFKNVKNNCLY